jgi:hypothetical protein
MLAARDRLGSLGVNTGDKGTDVKQFSGGRHNKNRSRWPLGLRLRSAASLLLGLRVQILPVAWMGVCFECCMLSGRGLCDGLITRPEKSY